MNLKPLGFKILWITVFLVSSIPSWSQRSKPLNLPKYDQVKLHFGMALGFNQMNATVRQADNFYLLDSIYSVECNPQMGFNINIVANYNINRFFSVRTLPGLNFGQRNMEYILYGKNMFQSKIMEIESTYLDLPILLQLKSARLNNFRMYMIAGMSYKYDLSSQKKIADKDKPRIKFKPNVFSYEVGVGTDYFLEYFKFAIEVKYTFGLNNSMSYDNTEFSTSIAQLTPRMFNITLLFEGSDIESLSFLKIFKKR